MIAGCRPAPRTLRRLVGYAELTAYLTNSAVSGDTVSDPWQSSGASGSP